MVYHQEDQELLITDGHGLISVSIEEEEWHHYYLVPLNPAILKMEKRRVMLTADSAVTHGLFGKGGQSVNIEKMIKWLIDLGWQPDRDKLDRFIEVAKRQKGNYADVDD